MRINSFKIRSLRGIKTFDAEPQSESIVISGPNGTGKSGVIDALDFLFSGDIQRLTGTGTRNVTLSEHGKHVDDDVSQAYVAASITLPNGNMVSVRRELSDQQLQLVSGAPQDFEVINAAFSEGQFQLTRRNLLRFIVAEASTRAEEIQALLDVSALDKIRRDLNSAVKLLEQRERSAERSTKSTINDIDIALDTPAPKTEDARRNRINELRGALGKDAVADWTKSSEFIGDIEQPETTDSSEVKRKTFLDALNALRLTSFEPPVGADQKPISESLKELLEKISQAVGIRQKLAAYDMLQLGLDQVSDEGACPLCDTPWKKHELIEHIKNKISLAEELKEQSDRFDELSTVLIHQIDDYTSKLSALQTQAEKIAATDLLIAVSECAAELQNNRAVLTDIARADEIQPFVATELGHIATSALVDIEKHGESVAILLPEESQEELAYKTLLKVSGLYDNAVTSQRQADENTIKKSIAEAVRTAYEEARQEFFSNLYAEVEKDFAAFYKILNEDEASFTAKIDDTGPSVDLTVDFYGRGMHPPIALHSEGHQDSMGICLYLALMKKLKSDGFTIALLDDVMMSIDIGHRRKLCQLLREQFSDTQLFITTHDFVWARQLKEFQIVKKGNWFQFRAWDLETGPVVDTKDAYEAARELAKKGDAIGAAALLRNTLEYEFQEVCAILQARVVFRDTHQWNPAELHDAALGRLRSLLKQAKKAANSWNKQDELESITAFEERLSQAVSAAQSDKWLVNPAVHYNAWANFSSGEMLATINAMEQLVAAFCCEECSGKLYVSFQDHVETILGCHCGNATRTLIEKKCTT